jgi:hypothetical protein
MSLSYLRDDYHKQAVTHIRESQWFESMYTLQGKTRPARHVRFPRQSKYARRTLPVDNPRTWKPFTSHLHIWTDPTAPEKKDSRHNPQHAGWPIHESIPCFSPKPTNEAVDLSQASVDDKLLGLLGPYGQHVIGTFNTCSRGSTHRCLTDTGGGYNLGGADFPYTTPRPSQPVVSPFHLRASSGLKLSINSLPSELEKGTNTKSREWEPPLDFYHTFSSKPSVR